MSKKKHSTRKQRVDHIADYSTQTLQQQADKLLSKGNYKEAIEHYKMLLKRETRPEWNTSLAEAYLQRGHELAAKQMYKEAAVMWENRATVCAVDSFPEIYIEWQFKAGRYTQAAQFYAKMEQTSALPPNFSVILGIIALGEADPATRANIAQGFSWQAQWEIAERILQDYCNGASAQALESQLALISARSPFRDLRILMKSLLTLEQDPKSAIEIAAKIPATSPYAQFARLLPNPGLQSWDPQSQPARPLPGQEALLACLYGWQPEQVNSFSALFRKLEANGSELLELVIKNAKGIGVDYARQLFRQWAPTLPEQAQEKIIYTLRLSEFEKACLNALREENEQYLSSAQRIWKDALKLLLADEENPGLEILLRASLIQRHRIILLRRNKKNTLRHLEQPLQDCITWNPTDQTSWLELIELYQQEGEKKTYYNFVNKALEKFPKDVQILLAGVEAASERKAFKKAAGYAQQILAVDSLNVKARKVLIDAHLSHAAKQLKAQKYHLIDKELQSAAQYERGTLSVSLRIYQAFFAFVQQNHKEALAKLEEAQAISATPLGCYALIFLESKEANLNPNFLARVFKNQKETPLLPPWPKHYLPSPEELLKFTRLMYPYIKNLYLHIFIKQWNPLLQKAANACAKNVDTLLVLCEFFKEGKFYAVLKEYAKEGRKQWKNNQIFLFYEIYADVEGSIEMLDNKNYFLLKQALDEAKKQDDQRTQVLINNFIRPRFPFDEDDDYDDEDDYDEDDDYDDDFPFPLNIPNNDPELSDIIKQRNFNKLLHYLFGDNIPKDISLHEVMRQILLKRLNVPFLPPEFNDSPEEGDDPFHVPPPIPKKPLPKKRK